MIESAIALLVAAGLEPCPDEIDPDYHGAEVCDPVFEGATAYSATVRGSMSPAPRTQQVMLYRQEGEWRLRIAGVRWVPGTSVVVTRRNDVVISDDDAEELIALLDERAMEELGAMPYMGAEGLICVDGARLEIARAENGQRWTAAQHSCVVGSKLRPILHAFREVALRYDPDAFGMLLWLRDEES